MRQTTTIQEIAMAEGARSWTSKVLCRYFVHGACRHGNSCSYSHDWADPPMTVCRFYLKGCCSYGDQCRYDHTKSSPMSTPPEIIERDRGKLLPPPLLSHDSQNNNSGMVKLTKNWTPPEPQKQSLGSQAFPKSPEEWVKANEFVPGQPFICSTVPSSYAKAAQTGNEAFAFVEEKTEPADKDEHLICPFHAVGECRYGKNCTYMHGNLCNYCNSAVLYPGDEEQNKKHLSECIKSHERDMELSFAVARSKDKVCGVCMEEIMEKQPPSERRFGILSNCNHVFCLACIRKWRAAKQFDSETVRCCPECRVKSDFITPSKYWVDTREEKEVVIRGYKKALSEKPCRYFKQGKGDCPFNDKCFYLHSLPDGTKPEPKPRKPRKGTNADGDMNILRQLILWDFLEERENRLQLLFNLADLDSLLIDFVTDSSDESDFDDYW